MTTGAATGARRPRAGARGPGARRAAPAGPPGRAGLVVGRAGVQRHDRPPSTSSCSTLSGCCASDDRAGLVRRAAAPPSASRRRLGQVALGGPSDLSTTVEAYYALRLLGVPADDPAMVRARELVHVLGGADRARFFTKLWLAVLGRYPWERLPVLPPEMILLPDRAPLSPYRFACWARGTFVALMIVLSRQPTHPPAGRASTSSSPTRPARGPAGAPKTPGPWTPAPDPGDGPRPSPTTAGRSARCAGWRRGPRGALDLRPPGGRRIVGRDPAALGLLDHRAARARASRSTTRSSRGPWPASTTPSRCDDGDRLRIQACLSPVWDTCLAAVALADAGATPDDPALAAGVRLDAVEGGHPLRRLAPHRAARPSGRLVVRVRRTSGTPTPTTPPRC